METASAPIEPQEIQEPKTELLDMRGACDLYARILIYHMGARPEQVRFTRDLKHGAAQATYHPDMLSKLYGMSHHLLDDWLTVARDSTPWKDKDATEKMKQIGAAFALNDATHKRENFHNPLPTAVWLKSREEIKCFAGARRLDHRDDICLTPEALECEEAWVLGAVFHEQEHLQVIDFNAKDNEAFDEAIGAAATSVNKQVDAAVDCGDFKTYGEEWYYTAQCLTEKLLAATENTTLSPAHLCQRAMNYSVYQDKRYKWYKRSPEESLVRIGQLYMGLLHNHTHGEMSDDVLMVNLLEGNDYVENAASIDFFGYIEKQAPDKTFTALGF